MTWAGWRPPRCERKCATTPAPTSPRYRPRTSGCGRRWNFGGTRPQSTSTAASVWQRRCGRHTGRCANCATATAMCTPRRHSSAMKPCCTTRRTAMTDPYANIRRALAMGCTPGRWAEYETPDGRPYVGGGDGSVVAFMNSDDDKLDADIALVAACDPDTIRALLAERDALARRCEWQPIETAP